MSKWIQETRPQFLTLAAVLVLHATLLALWKDGSVNWLHALLAGVGLILLQASVNVLNDWHDFSKTGIDKNNPKTPFSGGSGLLPAGTMTASQALALGVGTLVAGSAIGVYLAWVAGWELLAIGAFGVVTIVLYTPVLNRLGLGELFTGFALGTLPVVGTYFLLTGRFDLVAWVSGIPAGLLTYNLLLLNEFPDAEADAAGGRRHMVIMLGKARAAWLYTAVELGAYVAIAVGVALGIMTPWALLGLLPLVVALKAIKGALSDYNEIEGLIPSMGANVMAVLFTNILLGVGYLIAALLA